MKTTRSAAARLLSSVAALVALQACTLPEEAPVVSDFSIAESTAKAGSKINATATIEDGDGDLAGGKFVVKFEGDGASVTEEIPINAEDNVVKAAVSFMLTIGPLAPKGETTISLRAIDKAGNQGTAQSVSITVE